jgi:hypothetical protein
MAEKSPAEVVGSHLGLVDAELLTLIGQVVMLGALIEDRTAAIAMSIDKGPQNDYSRASFQKNLDVCKRCFPLFVETDFQRDTTKLANSALKLADGVLKERHEIVHRVWARPGGEPWGGHKGVHPQRSSRTKTVTVPPRWADYSSEGLGNLIRRMGDAVDTLQMVVGRITSFPRLLEAE